MTQHYIGAKQITAWPQDKDNTPGYGVKYPDGYTSWSPKEVFEKAYLPQGHDPSRITPNVVEEFITTEHYFTAMDGVVGHAGDPAIVAGVPVNSPLDLLTFCVLVLRNGYTVTGESACVTPANFDAKLGQQLARQKAVEKVWPLLGFLLATARNGI